MQSLKVVKNAGRGNGKSSSKQKENKGTKRSTSQQPSRKNKVTRREKPRTIQAPEAQRSTGSKIRRRSSTRARRVVEPGTPTEAGHLQEDRIGVRLPSGPSKYLWAQRIHSFFHHAILVLF
jgi:hypothetical protein